MKRFRIVFIFGIVFNFLFISVLYAASITGTVKFEGEVPKLREIKMDADPICLTHHDGPVYSQVLVLGEDNTIANVFVHIVGGIDKKQYPIPSEPAVLAQKGCLYEPHVLGVRVGQALKILNQDGILHNIHALAKINKEFNIATPKFKKSITRTFDAPEFMLSMKCDVHPWMGAYVSVMEHPFFFSTRKNGVYTINDLPVGEYKLEAWHEKLGTKSIFVTLAEGETKEIDFRFSVPKK